MKLRYTRPALTDLAFVLDDIGGYAPQVARRIQKRLQLMIDLLLQYPLMGARTDDPIIRRITTLPYPYLIFYEPTDTEIIVHAIRHAKRDPAEMPGSTV